MCPFRRRCGLSVSTTCSGRAKVCVTDSHRAIIPSYIFNKRLQISTLIQSRKGKLVDISETTVSQAVYSSNGGKLQNLATHPMNQTRPAELPRPGTQARRRASHLAIRQALKLQQQSFRSLSSYYSYMRPINRLRRCLLQHRYSAGLHILLLARCTLTFSYMFYFTLHSLSIFSLR